MFTVPPAAFIPSPSVESAVIRCKVRNSPPVEIKNEKKFFRIVHAAFAQRRKTLANGLKAAGITPEEVSRMLSQAGIDGMRRGETLSLAEFAAIADRWQDKK
jgi:16S rRNA (adenine1518-N6/adenine1519-N6)-dimethyltransferase